MSGISEQATYLTYATAWRAVGLMPESAAYATFDQLAMDQWRRRTKGVRQLERNLARVLGPDAPPEQVRSLSREGMRSYLRYWCDTFRLPGWSRQRVLQFDFQQSERMSDTLASGRGVIAALPHMGNWDHVGAFVTMTIAPVTTVAEKLRPDRLYRAFVELRQAQGMTILGLGEPGVFQRLAEVAAGGGLTALLADRDLSAKGIEVEFFGSRARFPAGAAALAVDTGAALLPVALFRGSAGNAGRVLPEVVPPASGDRGERIVATTQLLANAFEQAVAANPQDWHMLQKLWLADLDPARLAARDAAASG